MQNGFVWREISDRQTYPKSFPALLRRQDLEVIASAFAATGATVRSVDLTGTYECIQICRMGLVGNSAFVIQNGPQLNLPDLDR